MVEVTVAGFKNKFEVMPYDRRTVSWGQRFHLTDDNSNTFEGTLYWHEDDGYHVNWYGAIPDDAFLPEFEYVLDSILVGMDNPNVPTQTSNTWEEV